MKFIWLRLTYCDKGKKELTTSMWACTYSGLFQYPDHKEICISSTVVWLHWNRLDVSILKLSDFVFIGTLGSGIARGQGQMLPSAEDGGAKDASCREWQQWRKCVGPPRVQHLGECKIIKTNDFLCLIELDHFLLVRLFQELSARYVYFAPGAANPCYTTVHGAFTRGLEKKKIIISG